MEYDDETVLTRYVWDCYSLAMTEFERRVGRSILARRKAAAESSPQVAQLLKTRWGRVGEPDIDAALAVGEEAFRRGVCRRLLAERGDDIFVNRCPRCNRVVRTPKARQCFWCGHDWHP